MKRNKLIDNIINYMINNEYENSVILKEQYDNSKFELDEDKTGFNLFLVEYKGNLKTSKDDYEINTIGGKYNDLDIGFTIFIRSGILDEIDGYTYGDIDFPDSDDIELYDVTL